MLTVGAISTHSSLVSLLFDTQFTMLTRLQKSQAVEERKYYSDQLHTNNVQIDVIHEKIRLEQLEIAAIRQKQRELFIASLKSDIIVRGF